MARLTVVGEKQYIQIIRFTGTMQLQSENLLMLDCNSLESSNIPSVGTGMSKVQAGL